MMGMTLRRTALAMKVAILAMVGGAAPNTVTSYVQQGARLEVDISERRLRVYDDGRLINTFPIAVGQPEHPTPRGAFRVDRIIWNPGWVPPDAEWAEEEPRRAPDDPENPMVGAKLFFKYPDYYIHGTPATGSLGEAASHGCIRMNPVDVINLAKWVQAQGGRAESEAWFREIARDDGTSHTVRLPRPVRLVIEG